MDQESFEQMDRSFMKGFKPFRERKIPAEASKGLDAAVEKRIRAKAPLPLEVWVGVPALALGLCLLALAVSKFPFTGEAPSLKPEAAETETQELFQEVELLKALDAWTEEDDALLEISPENSMAELELGVPQLLL